MYIINFQANPRPLRTQKNNTQSTLTSTHESIHTIVCKFIYTYVYVYIYIYIYLHQPPRDTWKTDLGEVQPVWLEVRQPPFLFWVTFLTTTPNSRVSHPTVNTTHPLPGFLMGDTPWASSLTLDHSDQSTPAEVSTTLKISDIVTGLKKVSE